MTKSISFCHTLSGYIIGFCGHGYEHLLAVEVDHLSSKYLFIDLNNEFRGKGIVSAVFGPIRFDGGSAGGGCIALDGV